MKIAYLFSRYPVPSQTFCDTEMRALEERGCEIEIYSCSPPTTSFRHGAGDRARGPVFYAPCQSGLELGRQAALEAGTWPAALIADHQARFGARYEPARRALHAVGFAERLRERGIDHIHVHFANRATHAALFIQALTGIPFSFTAHAQDFLVDLGSDALLQEMCARAAFIVTVSDYSRQALVEKCPAAAGKIHRIYNGLPLARWPLPFFKTAETDALRIFSAGRLIDFKGFDDLIAACAQLRQGGVAFACDIAGEGPARAPLEEKIAALDLGGQVRLLGLVPQAEIRQRLAECDVFALASRVDAHGASDVLPTVILEAMAAGRPVVSTRLGGIPEMVVAGETGFLVEPGDPGELAESLAELAQAPLLRERFGRAGRARLETCFSAELASGQLEGLLAAALKTSVGAGAHSLRVSTAEQVTGDGLVLLLDGWPAPVGAMPPLAPLLEVAPGTRVLALKAGTLPPSASPAEAEGLTPTRSTMLSLVHKIDFLPDAIVLEAEWREQAAQAHRVEAWRGSLGAGLETDDFLLAARRALYLHQRWAREPGVRHIHAIGPAALLCAWLLTRLEPARHASFLLPAGTADFRPNPLPNSTLRRLTPGFRGGWLVGAQPSWLATDLGKTFYPDDPGAKAEAWHVWQNAICGWAARPDSEPFPPE